MSCPGQLKRPNLGDRLVVEDRGHCRIPRGHQRLLCLLTFCELEYQQFPALCEHDTGDDVSRKSLKVNSVAPEVLTVGHRDVVEVVFADSQDVSDFFQFLNKHGKHVSDLMAGCRI